MSTFIDLFEANVRDYRDNTAVVDAVTGISLTYGELDALAGRLAAKLQSGGVEKGDAVAVVLPHSIEFIAAMLAGMKLGAAVAPLNGSYPPDRLAYIFHDCQAKAMITPDFMKDVDDYSPVDQNALISPDDAALLVYTSGSTGNPKGVLIDHRAIFDSIDRTLKFTELTRQDVIGLGAPFFFIAGSINLFCGLGIGTSNILIPVSALRNPVELSKIVADKQVTVTFISPKMLRFFRVSPGSQLRLVVTGSERLSGIYSEDFQIKNVYGLSESCASVLGFNLDKAYDNTPVGIPLGDVKAYLLDEDGNEAGEGELCLTGHFARCYINRLEESEKTFVPNPFSEKDGHPMMLRTGDLARVLPDGNILYLNRRDWMVKINGQRVEPGEIEAALRKAPGIEDVAVRDFSDERTTFLAAYYVSKTEIADEELRQTLLKSLPSYMVPAFFVRLEKLPFNANGKLDRNALPRPDAGSFKSEYVAPETPQQETLCKAFAEVLKADRIGIDDDFFAMGGDSVKVAELLTILKDLPIEGADLYLGKTVRKVSELIEKRQGTTTGNKDFPVNASLAGVKSYPLTPMERGMYLEQKLRPESVSYNLNIGFFIKGVDADVIRHTVREMFLAHESLHSFYGESEGVPCRILADEPPQISDGKVMNHAAFSAMLEDVGSPFVLDKGIPTRLTLHPMEEGGFGLHMQIHHIAFDGGSVRPFLKELIARLKNDQGQENAPDLYGIYAGSNLKEDEDSESLSFYEKMFADGIPENEMPVKGVRPQKIPTTDTVLSYDLEEKEIAVLEEKAGLFGVTLFELMMSSCAATLGRYCGGEDVMVGVPVDTRNTFSADMIGMFVNMVPVRIHPKQNGRLSDYFTDTANTVRQAARACTVPFENLVTHFCTDRDTSRNPLFDMSFNYLPIPEAYNDETLSIDAESPLQQIPWDIGVVILRGKNTLKILIQYSSQLYDSYIIENFLEQFLESLRILAWGNADFVRDLTVLPKEQLEQLSSFNSTARDYEITDIVTMFRNCATQMPENTAVIFKDKVLSYREVDEISERIAAFLKKKGIGREDVVAVLIPRSEYIPLASLGILKSGAAYQPLDPGYPAERLQFMISDAKVKLLIADRDLMDRIPGYDGEVLCLDEISSLPAVKRKTKAPKPEDAFIVLYTSGSTGTPKGVVLEHQNLCNFCNWYREFYSLTPESRVAAYASYGFDACMMDLYPALTVGAAVVIVPEEIRLNLAAIQTCFEENVVTHSFMTTQVGRQFASFYSGKTLKHLSVGGETLVPVELQDKSFTFYNGYGPTECTIFTTIFPVDRLYNRVPIGKPLSNVRLYVVDGQGKLLPPGVPGELWISGCQVGREYLNQPEKTGEVFGSNPFTQEEGYTRIYRTGDVVRWTKDGDIDFLGRRDGQVKIRGFRIELTEVESVIREFPGVLDATVQAFDAPSGGKLLAAYLVADTQLDLNTLRDFIAKKKPAYMVPESIMQIEKIPLNQNQKVDRRALPKPEPKTVKDKGDKERRLTALEQELLDVLADILGNSSLDVDTPLTEAGLTSISTMQLMAQLEKKYGYSPDVSDLMRDMSLLDVENALVAHWREGGQVQQTQDAEDVLSAPVTQTQLGVYLECQMDETSDKYNIPMLFKLGADIDENRLAEAIRTAVEAHPAMKSHIEPDKEFGAVMVSNPDLEWEIPIEKSDLNDEQLETELSGEVIIFNLRRAPLYKFRIVRSKKSVYLSMVFHHILMDGASVAVLMEDIDTAYQGSALTKERYSSLQLCMDEKKRRSSDELMAAKAVYEGIFAGVSIDSLPDPEKSSGKEGGVKAVRHALTGLLAVDVEGFIKANNVTENALFTSAFAVLLARMGGCDEALFASVYNGRTRMETLRIMGMLVKTYPIYVNCDSNSSTTDFIHSVQKRIQDLTANDLYSFAEAVRDFGVNADIIFAYQGDSFTEFTLAGQAAKQIDRPLKDAKAPLNVDVWKKDGVYVVSFEYREDLYTEAQIRWMTDIYGMLVRGLIICDTLGQIPVVSAEAEAFLRDINDTKVDVPFRPVQSLMEEAAAEHPDRLAVITPTARVTYCELNESANRIAHSLIDLGASGRIVALILPRSEQVYRVRQGILKAGAAFLSITPDYPDDRIRAMMEDSDAAALVVAEKVLTERSDFLNGLSCQVVTVESLLKDERTDNPNQSVKKDDLAYCIFTSGSTGRPKGVMLTQGNLLNFLDANKKNPEILGYTERGHVSLALAAITFDVSIMEEFIPLCHGMTVCMATEEEIHNPIALSKLMVDANVDVMSCTPSFLSNCIGLSVMKEAFANIVSYDMGAEAFPAALFEKIRTASPNALIMNGYGPTEATISCTMDPVTDSGLITIGRPASNVRAYIIDEHGSILPPLLPGELVIAGEGVGRGYVQMSELTAERFITLDGYRAYRTGDLAAWTSDGRLRFHGRADNQVKLRGLRIELGEIENAINAVPGVMTSIVIMTGQENNRFLAGYYTASSDISPEELRDEIKKTLTSYMVPGVLTRLEEMPLTANGKIDKKKLPKVENVPEHKDYEAPANETEEFFCKLFSEVLGVDGIGATDDFFACGGTSLSATSVMIRATEENYPLSYGDVFKCKTPRALAAMFSKTDGSGEQTSPHTSGIFDDYDYTDINELLSKNTIESFVGSESRPIGNILLTGTTGYMGIHVLAEFLKNETGKAWCVVRKGKYKSSFERLKYSMFYYFQDSLSGMEDRIEVIDADVTNYDTFRELEKQPIDTVFNCAANVKHFSSGTDIEDINVGGAENMLKFCLATGARLIHFSTTSVGGYLMESDAAGGRYLDEQSLYFGQITDNQYLTSKLMAERIVLEGVAKKGADAKVIRVGSLSARESDGEFQINFLTNSVMGQLRSFAILKAFPYASLNQDMRFGPIDTSARSFMYLARAPKECCLFHAVNNHSTPAIDVIRVMQESGIDIELVEDDVFLGKLQEAEQDPEKAAILSSILAYKNIAGGAVPVVQKCEYTTQVLARSGFFWNIPDETYIRKFIEDMSGMAFFDENMLYR